MREGAGAAEKGSATGQSSKRLLEPDEMREGFWVREDRLPDPLALEHRSQPVFRLSHSNTPKSVTFVLNAVKPPSTMCQPPVT